MLIPNYSRYEYELTAELTDTQSKQTAVITLEGSATEYYQLLLFPVNLVFQPQAEWYKFYCRLFDNLALEISKTGMLE